MRSKPFWLALVLVLALMPLPAGASQQELPPPGLGTLSAPSDEAPEDIAIAFVQSEAAAYGVKASDVSELVVRTQYVSKHTGVTHVHLMQQHDGLDVFGAAASVSVLADGSVLFVGESLINDLKVAAGDLNVDATAAVAGAANGLGLDAPSGLRILDDSGDELVLSQGGISDEPIEAKLGWHATSKGLRLAWQLVIDDSTDAHLWNATVDAGTGSLVAADDWTSNHSVAELAHMGRRSNATAGYTASFVFGPGGSNNPVNDGSSYRVYGYPMDSPLDGDRMLVENPADAVASPFGWHDTNGAAGPEFTTTQGNNVHAYLDQDSNNTADHNGSPDGGPGLTFDFPINFNEHSQDYRPAVVANLFYFNNIIHDVLYLLGFDEVAGNFQQNNYGRGGAADGNGTNNANFSTPASDGGTPRMQMYLWPGNQLGSQNQVAVTGVGNFNAAWARYGPPAKVAGLNGQFVYVGNGCVAGDYPDPAPAGNWIAVADGGTGPCALILRSRTAEAAGAAGVVIAHNATGGAPIITTTGGLTTAQPEIPTVSVTQADGATIKAAIAAGTTTGTVRKHPDHPGIRDGDLDNGIIIHEYGHGISLRLTGPLGTNCLSGNEQMGEGWSDYYGLVMLIDPELDDPQKARGLVPYSLFQPDRHGNGLRPRPYSKNMNIQPFTYDMIKTNGWITGGSLAAPHGIGHAWNSVLWDMTWDLIAEHGFNPDLYDSWDTGGNLLSLQLVTDGLKIQGCGPGFVVGRNAIIAADVALTGGENHCLLWKSFARRGLGVSAIQGTTNRDDNTQAFDIPVECRKNQSRVNLDGATVPSAWQVPGAGHPTATAGIQIGWNQTGQVCINRYQLTGITPGSVTSVTLNSGGHGVPGGAVIATLTPNGCVGGVSQATLQDIRTNPSRYYISVNTAEYPGGALRGQLN